MPCSGQASDFAGLICNVVSCVCSASTMSCAGKDSDSWLGAVEDAGLSVDVSWVLAAGFVSGRGRREVRGTHLEIFTSHIIKKVKKTEIKIEISVMGFKLRMALSN